MGAGIPILALDYGACLAERVRHGENGFLFTSGRELAQRLFELLTERAPELDRLRRDIASSAPERWSSGWTREARPAVFGR